MIDVVVPLKASGPASKVAVFTHSPTVVVVPPETLLALSNPGSEPATLVASIPTDFRATGADGTEIGTPPWAA